jgi:DNA-binding NarL/FixJ family response regulator
MLNRVERDATFVGREAELDLLRQRFASAHDGRGQIVLLHGEAGIGKTSLAREISREIEREYVRSGWGRGYEGGWSPPYTPWREALFGPEGFNDFAGVDTATGDLSPDEARFHLHNRFLSELHARAIHQTQVIVIDDLQWADAGSLELLRHIAHFGLDARILIVATYRDRDLASDHHLAHVLPALHRAERITFIQLGGLQPNEIRQLVEVGDFGQNGDEMCNRIFRLTDGNPLFVSELIQNWAEDSESKTLASPIALESIPEGIRRVVEYRLARISPAARTVLNHVSVFSAGFDFAVLPHLTDLAEPELLDVIDELIAARLIEPAPHSGAERYEFVHALVRTALIDPLSPSRRVRLERSAAVAMERAYGEGAELYAEELAIQFGRSASLVGAENGLRYALIATDRARRGFDRERAVFFLRLARDLVLRSPPDVRAMVLSELAIAESDAVQIAEASATARLAIEALSAADASETAVARFYADLVTSLKQHASADTRIWRPLLEEGLAVASSIRDLQWARLMLLVDPVSPVSRETIRAGRWTGFPPEVVSLARTSGDERMLARAVESFEYRDREQTQEHLALVRTWIDPVAIMFGLTVVANDLQYRHGAYDQAEMLWEELIALAERQGAINWQAQATNQLTILHIARGRFDRARETERRAIALLDRLGEGRRSDVLALEMSTAFALELGGDWDLLAGKWLGVIGDPSLGPNDPATLMTAYYTALAAYCLAEAGKQSDVIGLLETLTPLLEALSPFDANQNGAVTIAAEAIWRLELRDLAPRYLALAAALRESSLGDYPQTSVALTLARMAALSNQPDVARRYFDEARTELTASRHRPVRAKVDFDEAHFLLRSGGSRLEVEELEASAAEAFAQLGMTSWVERSASLREAISDRSGDEGSVPGGLSERELEVLRLVARGLSDRQISDQLFISPRTVNSHIRNMLNKTGTINRTDLSVWWYKQDVDVENESA